MCGYTDGHRNSPPNKKYPLRHTNIKQFSGTSSIVLCCFVCCKIDDQKFNLYKGCYWLDHFPALFARHSRTSLVSKKDPVRSSRLLIILVYLTVFLLQLLKEFLLLLVMNIARELSKGIVYSESVELSCRSSALCDFFDCSRCRL